MGCCGLIMVGLVLSKGEAATNRETPACRHMDHYSSNTYAAGMAVKHKYQTLYGGSGVSILLQ